MKYDACPDNPHVVKVTYDGGNYHTYTVKLCKVCKEFPVFKNNILQVEELT